MKPMLIGVMFVASFVNCAAAQAMTSSSLTLLDRVTAERGMPALPRDIPPRAECLRGVRICIDPGHGGDIGPDYEKQHYKRGPTNLREAEVNLRTAFALRDLLTRAGAVVMLTRESDTTVTLEERSRLANAWPADLFLSIHHNATDRPEANFSSVWYHHDGSESPASLDVARNLSDSLARTLVLPDHLACGIYSDNLMYKEGFAVLRNTHTTAVLAECSFFTNPTEEELLRDPEYNRRVAWALFLGLCDWAANGVPRWEVVSAAPPHIEVRLIDGMTVPWGSADPRLRADSIRVAVNGKRITSWTLERDMLSIDSQTAETSPTLDIQFQNRAGNASITSAHR